MNILDRDFPRIRLNMLAERRKITPATAGDYATVLGFCLTFCTGCAICAWALVQIVLKIQ